MLKPAFKVFDLPVVVWEAWVEQLLMEIRSV